jgi:cysteine synthase/predicted amino acid-binding ACT domain protein
MGISRDPQSVTNSEPGEEARVGLDDVRRAENLQRTGSFKIRGAYNRMHALNDEERARGVVAASAGNHAQGVALAAQLLGMPSTVFMPRLAPLPKVAATRGYGADVQLVGDSLEETLAAAAEHSDRTGAVLVHPFDHPLVVAGQGTVGLEICEQAPDVRTVLVPTGGGGLAAGIAVVLRELAPNARVIGVQAAEMAAWPQSLKDGQPVRIAAHPTIADGIAVPLLLLHVIQHGLAAAGRYLSIHVRVIDRPGALAGLLGLIAELGGNVIDVEHSRVSGTLGLGEVEVALRLETRGPRHQVEVLEALRASGHDVS